MLSSRGFFIGVVMTSSLKTGSI